MKLFNMSLVCLLSTLSYAYGSETPELHTNHKKKRPLNTQESSDEGSRPSKKARKETPQSSAHSEDSFEDLSEIANMDDSKEEEEEDSFSILQAYPPNWAKPSALSSNSDLAFHKITLQELKDYEALTVEEVIGRWFPKNPYQILGFATEVNLQQQKRIKAYLKSHHLERPEARLLWVVSWTQTSKEREDLIQGAVILKKYASPVPDPFLLALAKITQNTSKQSTEDNPFKPLYENFLSVLSEKNGFKNAQNSIIEHASLIPQVQQEPIQISEPHVPLSRKSRRKRDKAQYKALQPKARDFLISVRKSLEEAQTASNQNVSVTRQSSPLSQEGGETEELRLTFSYPEPETINFTTDLRINLPDVPKNKQRQEINRQLFPKNPYQLLPDANACSRIKIILTEQGLGSRELRLVFALKEIDIASGHSAQVDEAKKKSLITQEVQNILKVAHGFSAATKTRYETTNKKFLENIEFLYNHYGIGIFSPLYEHLKSFKKQEGLRKIRMFVDILCEETENLSQDDLETSQISQAPQSSTSSTPTSSSVFPPSTPGTESLDPVDFPPPAISPIQTNLPSFPRAFYGRTGLTPIPNLGSTPSPYLLPVRKTTPSPIFSSVAVPQQATYPMQENPYAVLPPLSGRIGFTPSSSRASSLLSLQSLLSKVPPPPTRIMPPPSYAQQPVPVKPAYTLQETGVSDEGFVPPPVSSFEESGASDEGFIPPPVSSLEESGASDEGLISLSASNDEQIVYQFFLKAPFKDLNKLFMDIAKTESDFEFETLNNFYVRNGWIEHPKPGENKSYNWQKIFIDWIKIKKEDQERIDLILNLKENLEKDVPPLSSKKIPFYQKQIPMYQGFVGVMKTQWPSMPPHLSGFIETTLANLNLNLKNLELEKQVAEWKNLGKQHHFSLGNRENG